MPSCAEEVLSRLLGGELLTQEQFGFGRGNLSSYIDELSRLGFEIKSREVTTGGSDSKKSVREYWIVDGIQILAGGRRGGN
jgi:hypothetical protein